MGKQDMGTLVFTRRDRERMAAACQILGVTFVEFVTWATRHALDEIEGLDAEVERRRRQQEVRRAR